MSEKYDKLMSTFEDSTPGKTEGQVPKATEEVSADSQFEKAKEDRRRLVDKFNLDFSKNENKAEDKHSMKGGVYFSNPPKDIDKQAQREKRAFVRKDTTKKPLRVSAPPATERQKKYVAEKEEKAKKRQNTAMGRFFTQDRLTAWAFMLAIIVFISVILCVYGIGCINDVLAIKADDTVVEVEVSQGWTDNEVIDVLEDKGLIKNSMFCKLFISFFGKDGDYVSGVYTLSSDMGVEKMLSTMKSDITLSETITLTFPEGWTIDQMAEKLESNDVCTAASFISTLQNVDFSEEYDFIAAIPNKDKRFRVLEGYMYPDTYEFYIGESAASVARKFLDNFENRWTDEYKEIAKERGVSLDEIIILASILQEEAATSEQMPEISSVLYNRLNRPSAFPLLQCDSTEDYLVKTIKPTLTSSTDDTALYIHYRDSYDTYSDECHGLPIGAIANPGDAAIRAALKPADTSYLYFRHDVNGGVYYASSFAEHESNGRVAAQVKADD